MLYLLFIFCCYSWHCAIEFLKTVEYEKPRLVRVFKIENEHHTEWELIFDVHEDLGEDMCAKLRVRSGEVIDFQVYQA